MSNLAVAHDELRPLMFSIAYRMLGSVAEAEDVVQEAFLRMHRSSQDGVDVESFDAYATTITTRLAIDALRSARIRRERYIGPWLPEPLLADDNDPSHQIEIDETVSIAFLIVLERLSPLERAVFVLREVFGYEYEEIAQVVERGEDACRQLMSRARRHLEDGRPRFEPSPRERMRLARAFLDALHDGDVTGLEQLLAEDVVFYGDGGGKAPAVREPIHGAGQVARFLAGLSRLAAKFDIAVRLDEANGHPAATERAASGELVGVLTVDIVDGRVHTVRNVINPDKLRHLGPVGDLSELIGQP
jgi:RNA polymerase sigma-70 factor (TIGR02957 family)